MTNRNRIKCQNHKHNLLIYMSFLYHLFYYDDE